MNIHENTALLDAFVDGELTSDEMIQVQAHLDECPACQAYVDDALAIRAAFPTEDDIPLPADFSETYWFNASSVEAALQQGTYQFVVPGR